MTDNTSAASLLSLDRAAGVLLGTACGDALGAGYECDPPMVDGAPVAMIGGGLGPFEPGEWTDDTSMAVAVAEAASRGLDLRSRVGLDAVASGFLRWFAGGPKDVGGQTRAVLSVARGGDAAAIAAAARARFEQHPDGSAGNGALVRTAAVALAHLDDSSAVVAAAGAVSDLTHADPVSGEACALWSLAIRHAVLHGAFDGLRARLGLLPADRAAWWAARLDEAEVRPGRVVHQERLGGRGAAGRLVGDLPHAGPGRRPGRRVVSRPAPAVRAGERRPGRWRH